MQGYMSDTEAYPAQNHQQTGGARKHLRHGKTIKQRQAAKGRRDARLMINLADTVPHEVRESGFHYDEESSREVLEESRELGNQSDDEFEPDTNPVVKQQTIAYRVVTNKRPGSKPKVQIRGLALNYDNTQSPFVNATYLENTNNGPGHIVTGILDAVTRKSAQQQQQPKSGNGKKLRKRKHTAKKQK